MKTERVETNQTVIIPPVEVSIPFQTSTQPVVDNIETELSSWGKVRNWLTAFFDYFKKLIHSIWQPKSLIQVTPQDEKPRVEGSPPHAEWIDESQIRRAIESLNKDSKNYAFLWYAQLVDQEEFFLECLQLQKTILFIVFLNNHFTTITLRKKEEIYEIMRYEPLYNRDLNDYEQKIIEALKVQFKERCTVISNKKRPQEDGWSCGYRCIHFCCQVIKGLTMEQIEANPPSHAELQNIRETIKANQKREGINYGT